MRKRKWMTALSVLLLSAGLVACSSPKAPTKESSEEKQKQQSVGENSEAEAEPVTLRFMWWGGESRHEATLNVIKAFEGRYPNVKIEAEYGGDSGYREKLTTQLASGTAADIIQNGTDWMSEITASGDFFVDISQYPDLFDTSDFDQNFLQSFGVYRDKMVAVPTGVNVLTMVLNKQVLAEAGIEAEQDWTWEMVIDKGKMVHQSNPDRYFLALSSNNLAEFVVRSGVIQQSGSQFINDDNSLGFDREQLLKMMGYVKELYDSEVIPPLDETLLYTQVYDDPRWVNGGYGGSIVWTSALTPYLDASESLSEHAVCVNLPGFADEKNSGILIRPSQVYNINKDTASVEYCLKFLDFMFNDPEAQEILKNSRGIPPTKSAQKLLEEKELVPPVVIDATEKGMADAGITLNDASYQEQLRVILIDNIQAIAFGQSTPEEATDNIIEQFTNALNNAN